MAIVLHHSAATGTDLVVMLGIANHDGDGGSWPSLLTLATYARYKGDDDARKKSVRKVLRRLEAAGEIRTHIQEGGLARTPEHLRTNRYEVLLQCPADCDRTTNHRTTQTNTPPGVPSGPPPGGRQIPPGGLASGPPPGVPSGPPNRPVPSPESSKNLSLTADPPDKPNSERETTFDSPPNDNSEVLDGEIVDDLDPFTTWAIPYLRKAAPDITETEALAVLADMRSSKIDSLAAFLPSARAQIDIAERLQKRRDADALFARIFETPQPAEKTCGCHNGWLGVDDQDRPKPCPTCRPRGYMAAEGATAAGQRERVDFARSAPGAPGGVEGWLA